MTTTSPSDSSSLPERLAVRARLVAGGGVVGVAVGGLSVLAFGASGVVETVFALGALVLGFALVGWSGSILVGGAVENMKTHLDLSTDWTEADSRRAMARLGGFGAGVMVGIAAVGSLLAGIS